MKTRNHGHGLNHKQVVNFSNRLALQSLPDDNVSYASDVLEAWANGWEAACKYFAHALRQELRFVESLD